jgi:hypothetical protein
MHLDAPRTPAGLAAVIALSWLLSADRARVRRKNDPLRRRGRRGRRYERRVARETPPTSWRPPR